MFDNAIEACKKAKDSPFISLSIKTAKMNLMITMENSSDGHYQYDNAGELQSTKEEASIEHGLGIQRIKEIVEEANGIIRIIPEEECFKLTILLPLEDMKHDNQNMRD
jgi:sensor histidine kinase regulating citrate/malate metabolism